MAHLPHPRPEPPPCPDLWRTAPDVAPPWSPSSSSGRVVPPRTTAVENVRPPPPPSPAPWPPPLRPLVPPRCGSSPSAGGRRVERGARRRTGRSWKRSVCEPAAPAEGRSVEAPGAGVEFGGTAHRGRGEFHWASLLRQNACPDAAGLGAGARRHSGWTAFVGRCGHDYRCGSTRLQGAWYVSQSVIARTDRIWRTRYSVQREHGRKEKEDDGS